MCFKENVESFHLTIQKATRTSQDQRPT